MSKHTSLFTILLLLLLFLFTLSSASRHGPTFVTDSALKPDQYEEVEAEKNMEIVGGSCEGAADKDECLMRRTLAAHTDYIYTQKQKP